MPWDDLGSSPLARGLPGRGSWRRPQPADHPRSRGVYGEPVNPGSRSMGSSPLARGLRDTVAISGTNFGIIPARAGFTSMGCGPGRPPQDHPRSRGVYYICPFVKRNHSGSSPLARGLPSVHHINEGPFRIIPARAGFTGPPERRPNQIADHPRSRGVYRCDLDSSFAVAGSSPLARGLPVGWLLENPRAVDHPRSRGVYCPGPARRTDAMGSSPLARGLHKGNCYIRGYDGIIPARAGFTCRRRAAPRSTWDHPRSRGVYATSTARIVFDSGSSPLARGLPGERPAAARVRRIIPARAGFTGNSEGRVAPVEDHPRSRGVYGDIGGALSYLLGSSPLARGLPAAKAAAEAGGGIIPARAGFTCS